MHIISQEIERHLPLSEESRRLFHGRGHCFPGYDDLLIDWFGPIVVVSLYRQRAQSWLQDLVTLIKEQVEDLEGIVLQERFLTDGPMRMLWGLFPEAVDAVEAGLRFRLRLGEAQNIGFFPDMAVGRALVKKLSPGKRVLNLFAFTCSFSVAALAGEARQIVNLDMNRGALELGRLNHQLNQQDLRRVGFLSLECFRSIGRLRRLAPFEVIICDPPAYQGKSFKAERDWPKLLKKIPDLLAPGGDFIACLNGPHLSPNFILELFTELRPEMRLVQQLQPGDDFPEADPERGVWLFHYRQEGIVSP